MVTTKAKIETISLGLLATYCVFIFLSIAVMEALSFLILIIAVVILNQKSKNSISVSLQTGINRQVFFLFAVCLIGFVWNGFFFDGFVPNRFHSFRQFRWIVLFFSFYILFYPLNFDKILLRVLKISVVMVILLGLYAAIQRTYGVDLIRGGQGKVQNYLHGYYRAIGTFSGPITFGNSMAMISTILLAAFLNLANDNRKLKILAGIAFLFGVLAVGFSYTRGAILGLAFGSLVVMLTSGRRVAYATLAFCVAIGLAIFFIDTDVTLRVRSIFNTTQSSAVSRFYIWKAHLAMFQDHVWFGVGYNYNDFAVAPYFKILNVPEKYWMFTHAHNNIIQFLGGTGITGTTAYLWLTAAIFFLNVKLLKSTVSENSLYKTLIVGFLGLHMAFFTTGFTEATFRDSELRNMFLFFLALLLVLRNQNHFKSQKPKSHFV